MKKFHYHTINDYLNVLAKREPVPGGGSAAALSGACGAALISMVTRYSLGRDHSKVVENRLKKNLQLSENIRKRFTQLVDLDAKAYLKIVKVRKGAVADKKKAQKEAASVPKEVGRLCQKAITLTPFLVKNGNPYLIADVEIAVEMLYSAYHSSKILIK